MAIDIYRDAANARLGHVETHSEALCDGVKNPTRLDHYFRTDTITRQDRDAEVFHRKVTKEENLLNKLLESHPAIDEIRQQADKEHLNSRKRHGNG